MCFDLPLVAVYARFIFFIVDVPHYTLHQVRTYHLLIYHQVPGTKVAYSPETPDLNRPDLLRS